MARRKPLHTVAGRSPGLASQSHGLSAHHAGSATPARVPKLQAVPSRHALSGHEILPPPRRAHGSPDVVAGARCRGASGLSGAALLHHAPASGRCRWFASCRCRRSPVACSWRSRPRIVRYQGGLRRAGGPAELQRRPSRIRAAQRCVVRGAVRAGPVRLPGPGGSVPAFLPMPDGAVSGGARTARPSASLTRSASGRASSRLRCRVAPRSRGRIAAGVAPRALVFPLGVPPGSGGRAA